MSGLRPTIFDPTDVRMMMTVVGNIRRGHQNPDGSWTCSTDQQEAAEEILRVLGGYRLSEVKDLKDQVRELKKEVTALTKAHRKAMSDNKALSAQKEAHRALISAAKQWVIVTLDESGES